MINLIIVFLLATTFFYIFDITTIPNLISSVINYLSSGPLFNGIKSIFKMIGKFFDSVIFNSSDIVYTSGGVALGSLVWVGLLFRIILVIFLIRLVVRLVL